MLDRRQFLLTSLSAAAALAARAPIKLAARQGNMVRGIFTPGVYELAASIGGISGVEVQTVSAKLWDKDTALAYKRESLRWAMRTSSMGGTMSPGASLVKPATVDEPIRKAIATAEILGAGVVLVPAFRQDCPVMTDQASYGPVVEWLQKMGSVAADSGVILGLELSLSLAEHHQLMELVNHPAVRIYWDANGVDSMKHPGEGIQGIETLGTLICQQHLKNGRNLMEESGLIDWTKGLPAIKASGYEGWLSFETTSYPTPEEYTVATRKNVAFVTKYLA